MILECPLHDIRSKSLNFFGTDTEEMFQKNLNYIKMWDWKNTNIAYDINSLGYRSKELIHVMRQKYFVTFGCSHTVGVGLPLDTTYSNIISNELGLNYFNAGVNGGSNELILMNLYRFLMLDNKPEFVIIQWTYPTRKMYFLKNEMHVNLESDPYKKTILPNSYSDYLDHYDDIPNYFDEIRNNAIALCKLANVKLIEFKVEDVCGFERHSNIKSIKTDIGRSHNPFQHKVSKYKSDFFARDLLHPGKLFNNEIVKHVKQCLT